MLFKDYDFSENLQKSIAQLGYETPTEIQKKALPLLLDQEVDLLGQAQTGTGKTAAFLIPLIERLDMDNKSVQALIMTPTRELAQQVLEELRKLGQFSGVKAMSIYGGTSYTKQFSDLSRMRPQVVVGTPGRTIDLINKKKLKLENCETIIIDEADEMLNMGFLDDIEFLLDASPSRKSSWMFSATVPRAIQTLINKKFNFPKIIKAVESSKTESLISQHYCILKRRDFLRAMSLIIESETDCTAIAFCETRQMVINSTEYLQKMGLNVACLHGDLRQGDRDIAMKRFKNQDVNILVCTDIAARGLDISHVSHVFNLGLPRSKQSYVHRVGRTGRAGKSGVAISFLTPNDQHELKMTERETGKSMTPYILPETKNIKKKLVENELEHITRISEAVKEKKDDFKTESAFDIFAGSMEDLSKDEVLKVMFTYQFRTKLRAIDQRGEIEGQEFGKSFYQKRNNSRGRRGNGGGRRFSKGGATGARVKRRNPDRDRSQFKGTRSEASSSTGSSRRSDSGNRRPRI